MLFTTLLYLKNIAIAIIIQTKPSDVPVMALYIELSISGIVKDKIAVWARTIESKAVERLTHFKPDNNNSLRFFDLIKPLIAKYISKVEIVARAIPTILG